MISVRRPSLIVAAILAVASVALAQTQSENISGQVLNHIAKAGARQAISDYYEKPIWKEILKGIASGTQDWLNVYSALRPGSDAGSGEDLGEAIFDAIPTAPFSVLPLLYSENRGRFSITELCTFTFEASVPDGGINAYLTRIEQSMKSASTSEQRSIREACVRGVVKTREAFKDATSY